MSRLSFLYSTVIDKECDGKEDTTIGSTNYKLSFINRIYSATFSQATHRINSNLESI